jgi:hypothetical protein
MRWWGAEVVGVMKCAREPTAEYFTGGEYWLSF